MVNGKEFKELINKVINDNDVIVLVDKYCGDNCLYIMDKSYIRRKNDGEHDIVLISVRDFK